jgi:hemoglobin-like flavoprotein
MALDGDLLRDSFELVVQRDQEFPRLFYQILFERHPEAKALFTRNTPGAQNAMLAQTLMAILDHLEDPAWLTEKLGALGAQHLEYGVTEEMYDWVGEALVTALAEVSAADWTEAHGDAWSAAYGVIVTLMRTGERKPA